MVSALRASNKCLGCHNRDRGKLLGAFSYELVPLPEKIKVVPTENTPKPNNSAAAF